MFSSNSSHDSHNRFDTLVVGHGLAGAILTQVLRRSGQRVLVIDQPSPSSASRVAAGIINPVTGHRLNITQGFDRFYPEAIAFYQSFEQEFGCRVFTPVSQTRLIKNAGQQEYYEKRRTESAYDDVLGRFSSTSPWFNHTPYGIVEIRKSGVVNTKLLLDTCAQHMTAENSIQTSTFDHDALSANAHGFEYKGSHAKTVVFCEGSAATKNPWLSALPFKLSKGEIIDLKLAEPVSEFLNWGHWLVPGAEQTHARLGSTYEWSDFSATATQTDRLMKNFHQFIGLNARVLNSKAGIRPTTRERQPFVGEISNMPGAYCFNGFGSKGCLLIPYFANRFLAHLNGGQELPEENTKWL